MNSDILAFGVLCHRVRYGKTKKKKHKKTLLLCLKQSFLCFFLSMMQILIKTHCIVLRSNVSMLFVLFGLSWCCQAIVSLCQPSSGTMLSM